MTTPINSIGIILAPKTNEAGAITNPTRQDNKLPSATASITGVF